MQHTKALSGSCVVEALRTEASRELMARGIRPNFADPETVECIVTNSSGFVSDTSIRIMRTDPISTVQYPNPKAALGLLPIPFHHMKRSHAS